MIDAQNQPQPPSMFERAKYTDSTVASMLRNGETLSSIIGQLADDKLKLIREIEHLSGVAPKKVKLADGRVMMWHCPDDLVPFVDTIPVDGGGSAMKHVDDWVRDMGFEDKPEDGEIMYARWLMMHWRLPAYMKSHFLPIIGDRKLFCTYEGNRYRCIGGSRMGDVWLTSNFDSSVGYEKRVDVSKCSGWSAKA